MKKMRIQESHETFTSKNSGCKEKFSQSPRQDIEPQTSGALDSFRVPGKPPEGRSGKKKLASAGRDYRTKNHVLQFLFWGVIPHKYFSNFVFFFHFLLVFFCLFVSSLFIWKKKQGCFSFLFIKLFQKHSCFVDFVLSSFFLFLPFFIFAAFLETLLLLLFSLIFHFFVCVCCVALTL